MIRAMIFDLDGTLVQTEKLKALSYARAAVALRPELKEADVIETFKDVVGSPRHEVAQTLRTGCLTPAGSSMIRAPCLPSSIK